MNEDHFFNHLDSFIAENKKLKIAQGEQTYENKKYLHELIEKLKPLISKFSTGLEKRFANFNFKINQYSVKFTITNDDDVERFLLLESDENNVQIITSSPIDGITNHPIYTNVNPFDDLGTFNDLLKKLILENYRFHC